MHRKIIENNTVVAYVFPIDGAVSIPAQTEKIGKRLYMGITSGAMDVTVSYQAEKITNPQRKKSHAMINDIRKMGVIKLPGKRIVLSQFSNEQLKAFVVVWFANETALNGKPLKRPPAYAECPITGEKITIRPSTTDFEVSETVDFIEYLYSLGCDSGVIWSEPALAEYQSYKEAQQ